MKNITSLSVIGLLLTGTLLSACNDDDDDNRPGTHSYRLVLTNLTANQPLSPAAIIMHQSGYHAFKDGEPASQALEILAEGGDNSQLLTEAEAQSAYLSHESGGAPIGPGSSETFELTTNGVSDIYFSVVSMLVNTNDAFTGLNAHAVRSLHTGASVTLDLPAWDAGTEANSEAAGTIPGPADGGTGYSDTRDDLVDFVGIHRGVVSKDDGLSTSVLHESHRFDNPVASLTITRID